MEKKPFSAARLRDEPELLNPGGVIVTDTKRCKNCDMTPVPAAVDFCQLCLDEAEQELKELGY